MLASWMTALILSGGSGATPEQIKASKERHAFLASGLVRQGFSVSPFHKKRADYLKRRPTLQTVSKVQTNEKVVYLTFDDGPLPGPTDEVLNILEQEQVKATFFLVGSRVDEAPFLAQDIKNRGHDIGNHTYYHPNLTWLSPDQIRAEILATNWTIERHTGVKPVFGRAPGGNVSKTVNSALLEAGLISTLWTINPGDLGGASKSHITNLSIAQAKPGAVILLHEFSPETRAALPGMIKGLKAQGWRFGTLSESGAAGTVTP